MKKVKSSPVNEQRQPTQVEVATTEVLEILTGFTRFDQNKIIAAVLEANLAERKIENKRTKDESFVAIGAYEELASIIKNQSV